MIHTSASVVNSPVLPSCASRLVSGEVSTQKECVEFEDGRPGGLVLQFIGSSYTFSYLFLIRVPTTVVHLCLPFDSNSYQHCWAARGNHCTIISLTCPYVPLFVHIFSCIAYLNPTSSTFVPHASLTQTTTLSPDI